MMTNYKQLIIGLCALSLLAVLFLAQDVPFAYADEKWQAKYWNNRNLSGDPVVVREEADLNFNWGDGSPAGVHSDDFSARWKRTINVPAGTYMITATMDDGMRVWVDNNLIIDSWTDSQEHSISAPVNLSSGDHALKVEYYEKGGKASAKLRVEATGAQILKWRGEYFNNKALSGVPALVRDDQQINFDWGGGTPAWGVINADNFSVRWTRSIDLDPGRYRWTATTDDGVRLWVNGRLIIDQWHDQSAGSHSAETDVPGGMTDIRMEYYENVGGAYARLDRVQLSDSTSASQWRGEYFNNKQLSGSPALVRDDRNIDFNWGNGSPGVGVNADNFSVRWTRSMDLAPGRYRFTAVTDDGVRLWVNGQQIINDWVDRKPSTSVGEISLPGGNVAIKMEYYDNAGGAKASLAREQITAAAPTPTPLPAAAVGIVPGLRLNMRSGPAVTFAIIDVLAQGEKVTLVGRNAAATWIKVANSSSLQGWVYGPLLQMSVTAASLPIANGETTGSQPPPASSGQTAAVSNAISNLNVRSGPGVSHEPITTISRGQIVELLARDSSSAWLKIRTASGIVGWSSARYLDTSYPISSLPVKS